MKRLLALLAAFVVLLYAFPSAAENADDEFDDELGGAGGITDIAFPGTGVTGHSESSDDEEDSDEFFDDEEYFDDDEEEDPEPVHEMTPRETEDSKAKMNELSGYHDDNWVTDDSLHFTYIALPDGVSCKTLLYSGYEKELTVPEKIGGLTVKVIGNSTFSGKENLETVILPATVELIEERAFFSCANLRSIRLQEGLIMLERACFGACTALESLEIPASVEIVGEFAFLKCSLLPELVFSESLREIGPNAFYLCESLEKVVIPRATKQDDLAWAGVPENMEIIYLD